ncbi:MAG: ABC transporter permease [Bacillota bacterium]|nr:ABC transporter permease [Bacillota bacterium]
MARYVFKRVANLIPLLLVVSIMIFLMVRVTPTDPVASMVKGKKISQETRASIEAQYYLDRSLPEQYLIWMGNIFRGNFGTSFQYKQPVTTLLGERLPTTLQLVLMASVLSLAIALPVGILSAIKMNSGLDRILQLFTLLCVAMPVFLMSIILMLVFAYRLGWFPVFGVGRNFGENLYYLALPSIALALNMVALIARITRTNMIEQLHAPYAQTAIAKGTPFYRIVLAHCFKNAVIPVITVASIQFGSMIVGAVLVENVFALGGVGVLLVDSIKSSDYPVTQSITLMMVVVFLAVNLLVDVVYAAIDPRIRLK